MTEPAEHPGGGRGSSDAAPAGGGSPADVALIEVTTSHLAAYARGPAELERILGLRLPGEGWPEHPEALAYTLYRLTTHPDESGWWMYLFADATAGRVVGSGGFKGPPRNGTVEIGYEVGPAFRRRGYATAAAMLLVERAFADARVNAVDAHTLAEENASAKVLRKAGFRRTGTVPDAARGELWHWRRPR